MYRYLFIVSWVWVFVTATVQAESRLALVIGNGDYQHEPKLDNPANDAKDMAEVLKNLGFEVLLKPNLGKREMVTVVREFGDKLPKYDVGLFYYSGHGLQADGVNYLVPVDAQIKNKADIEFESVDANRILAYMEQANNGVNIVILDACRDNPFQTNLKGVKKGLAEMKGPTGSLIAFSTAPNKPSWGGEKGETNSVYTKHLLRVLQTQAQLSVLDLLTDVAGSVKTETKGEQVPWKSDSLTERFYFSPSSVGDLKPIQRATELPPTVPTPKLSPASKNSKEDEDDVFLGDIIFVGGTRIRECQIMDHNPGPIGSGWNEKEVGFSETLDELVNHETNRDRKLKYGQIKRIDVLPLNSSEEQIITRMDSYDVDKIMKCNITFEDGSTKKNVFLLPHSLKYQCKNEKGKMTRTSIKTIEFH